MATENVVSLDRFLADIDALRSGVVTGPSSRMRLRYSPSWGIENSIIEMAMARHADSSLKVRLYPEHATPSTRAVWEFFVDPLVDLEGAPERSECCVMGEMAPGRGVLVTVGGLDLVSTTPLRMPIRGKKFGRS